MKTIRQWRTIANIYSLKEHMLFGFKASIKCIYASELHASRKISFQFYATVHCCEETLLCDMFTLWNCKPNCANTSPSCVGWYRAKKIVPFSRFSVCVRTLYAWKHVPAISPTVLSLYKKINVEMKSIYRDTLTHLTLERLCTEQQWATVDED